MSRANLLSCAALNFGLGIALVPSIASAQDAEQIKIVAATGNVSTANANTYYPTTFTSTRELWGPDPAANRPVEIKELARALKNNVDLIYEYVHDNIKTVPMYGLQKGALGAIIDQSGTPFDQAELMVELLRESGYTAAYKAGTITLSTAQVNSWIGTSNTTAAQKIFRDGGIPVDFASGNFTIGHIWVEVTIGGSTHWFDPSYKSSTFKTPLANLPALMGITNEATEFATTGTSFFTSAWTGLGTQTTVADPVWVTNVNNTNILSKLEGTQATPGYSRTLLTNLKTAPYNAMEIDDVIGGQDIVKTGVGPIRNGATLPGVAPIAQRTWGCTSNTTCGIPDPYRTKLTLSMVRNADSLLEMTKSLFVDEFYGRRMMFDTGVFSFSQNYESFCLTLRVDGSAIAGATVGCGGATTPAPPGRLYRLRFEVDHPYANSATQGTYMDRTVALGNQIEKLADFALPVSVVYAFGDVSPTFASKLSAEVKEDRLLPCHVASGNTEPECTRSDSAMDHTMMKVGLSYAAQYSRIAEIEQRLGNSLHQLQHMFGVVYQETDIRNDWPAQSQSITTLDWYLRDRTTRISVDGAISVNSKSDTASERQKVVQSTLAAASTLEGSVFEQMLDTPFVGSTARRFAWGRANVTNLKYYLYRPNSPAPGGGFGSDFGTAGCASGSLTPQLLPNYVNATLNFWAIVPAEKCLGPGNKYGHKFQMQTDIPSTERGQAFMAFKPDFSGVAHVVGYTEPLSAGGRLFKGGGAAVAPEYAKEFDAAGAASLLKDKFEDKNRLHGIDLQSGDFTYSAPADISIGEGGFPYELAFARSFKGSASHSPGFANGWAHDLDMRVAMSGDGLAKMGTDSAQAAAETIVAVYVSQKIYEIAPTLNVSTTPTNLQSHLKRWVVAPFVMDWWGQRLTDDVVTLTAGHSARQFTKFADGAYYPPRNGIGTLVKNGSSRTLKLALTQDASQPIYDTWNYAPITSVTFTSPERDIQNFSYFEYVADANSPPGVVPVYASGNKHGWHLASWNFPFGVNLTYSYVSAQIGLGAMEDRLTSVSNNLGRSLTLTYVASQDSGGVVLSSVSDGQGRSVTYTQPGFDLSARLLTQVTSPENANGAEIAKYDYIGGGQNVASIPAGARPQLYPKMWKLFAPSDQTNPKQQVDYDRTWRAKEFRDAVAILTPAQRAPWKFYIAGTSRGERGDPLDMPGDQHLHTAYFDYRGRTVQVLDEEVRVVNQKFDNKDRVVERTYPEGNKEQFAYDAVTQQVKQITKLPKSNSFYSTAIPNIVVSATYDPICAKVKTVTDARGKTTTWNYNSGGGSPTCTLANIQQPQVPNPQASNVLTTPTTSFLYDLFGQVAQITDPTNRVVVFDYDATTKYRWKRRVDPSGLNLTTEYGHNVYGDISFIKDPRLNQTNYAYDKMRRITQVNAPLGSTTKNVLDVDGNVREVWRATDAANTTWQKWYQNYTPTNKVYQQITPTSAFTTTFYDALDRVDYVQDADGRKTKTVYFKDGQNKQIIKAYQSASMTPIVYATYTYTGNGQIDTVTDADGNVSNLDYDGFDRLARTFYPDPSTGIPCVPALPHSAAAPSCGSGQKYEEIGYDPNGNVTSKRKRSGNTITFAFDDLNRETTRNVPNNVFGHFARTLTTTYDLADRDWDLTADGQTISSRYDSVARLDFVSDGWIAGSNNTDYGYDAAGNRTYMAWPGGGSLTYTYDALNRMDTVSDSGGVTLADYDWDVLSRKDLVRFNNSGLSTDYGYEADDDLNLVYHSVPIDLSWNIGRNNSGQITSISVNDGAFLARPATTKSEAYVPNRLNQIASVNGTPLTYDLNGNLTSDGTFTFEYDEENRLRTAIGNGKTISYEYDPIGRRRQKDVSGVGITKFISDGAEEIEERDSGNNVLRRYAYGSNVDERVAMLDNALCSGGGRCFYQTNWQGSTVKLLNQSNVTIEIYQYGPFGERVDWSPQAPETGNPFRYTGRRFDSETGLYYYRARYYSPKLGRFLQTEPTGGDGDLNLYRYANNNPLTVVDPSGLSDINMHAYQYAQGQFNFRAYADSFNTQYFDISGHGGGGILDSRGQKDAFGVKPSPEQMYEMMKQAGYKQGQPALFNACTMSRYWVARLANMTQGKIFFQEKFPYQGHGATSRILEVRGSTSYPVENAPATDGKAAGMPSMFTVAIPLGDSKIRVEAAGFSTIVVDLDTGKATFKVEKIGTRIPETKTICVDADKCGKK
jgi:RHS repeat-associated protein